MGGGGVGIDDFSLLLTKCRALIIRNLYKENTDLINNNGHLPNTILEIKCECKNNTDNDEKEENNNAHTKKKNEKEEEEILLFQTNPCYNTLNPSWVLMDLDKTEILRFEPTIVTFTIKKCKNDANPETYLLRKKHIQGSNDNNNNNNNNTTNINDIKVDIVEEEEEENNIIHQWKLNVKDIVFLPYDMTLNKLHFPPNTILFELITGILITRDLLETIGPKPEGKNSGYGDQITEEQMVSALKDARWDFLEESDRRSDVSTTNIDLSDIQSSNNNSNSNSTSEEDEERMRKMALDNVINKEMAKVNQEAVNAYRIASIQKQVDLQSDLLLNDKKMLQNEQAELEKECDFLKTLMEQVKITQTDTSKLANEMDIHKDESLELEFLLECRQIKLLSELQSIYPITRVPSSQEFAIRGLEIPSDINDYKDKDDEHISSALGYVCHLVFMLSKYLRIPVRYQLDFKSSRSSIKDSALGNSAVYPLFKRGVERERFERAISLLEKDIQQILHSRGISFNYEAHMLQNLHTLFLNEIASNIPSGR